MEFNSPLEFNSEMLFKKDTSDEDSLLRKLLDGTDDDESDYEVKKVKVLIGGFDSIYESKNSDKCYLSYLNEQFVVLEPYEQLKERIKKHI